MWVFAGGVTPSELLRARQQQLQIGEITVWKGKIDDFLRGEVRCYIGAIGLEQGDLVGVDGHSLAGGADGERGLHLHRVVREDADLCLFKALEALCFDLDVVGIGDQVLRRELTAVVGGQGGTCALGYVGYRNGRLGDSGTCIVRYRPVDRPIYRLRESARPHRHQCRTQQQCEPSFTDPCLDLHQLPPNCNKTHKIFAKRSAKFAGPMFPVF